MTQDDTTADDAEDSLIEEPGPYGDVTEPLEELASPLHHEIGRSARLNGIFERALELTEVNGNVTHRQTSIGVYLKGDAVLFTSRGLDRAYSADVNGLGKLIVSIVRGTDFAISFYDLDVLPDDVIRYLGGPIAREWVEEKEEEENQQEASA